MEIYRSLSHTRVGTRACIKPRGALTSTCMKTLPRPAINCLGFLITSWWTGSQTDERGKAKKTKHKCACHRPSHSPGNTEMVEEIGMRVGGVRNEM